MKKLVRILSVVGIFSLMMFPVRLFAQQNSSSPNYELDEAFIGPGGTLDSSSDNYEVKGSVGDLGVGERSSANYNLLAGFTTDAEPTLVLVVNAQTINLGELSTSSTATTTASFSVGAYNSDNIVVQTVSEPPRNSDYTLKNIASAAASQSGTEQFGINLRANTNPEAFGADPVQVPDSTFSFAEATSGYNTADLFQYNQNDIIASSNQSTGQTDFTMSYIFNIGPLTPGGSYEFNHVLVATSTY